MIRVSRRRAWLLVLIAALFAADVAGLISSPTPLAHLVAERP